MNPSDDWDIILLTQKNLKYIKKAVELQIHLKQLLVLYVMLISMDSHGVPVSRLDCIQTD